MQLGSQLCHARPFECSWDFDRAGKHLQGCALLILGFCVCTDPSASARVETPSEACAQLKLCWFLVCCSAGRWGLSLTIYGEMALHLQEHR